MAVEQGVGVPETGAVLVRPDGHVAWRAPRPAVDERELLGAVRRLLAASGQA